MHRGLTKIFKKIRFLFPTLAYLSIRETRRGKLKSFTPPSPNQELLLRQATIYRELSPDYILIRLDMILRQVFYLSNLSCPVCGGVTVRLAWNLGIIRYEFCLYRNTISLYFGIQGPEL